MIYSRGIMKTGENGLSLIKHFEQLRLKTYLDSVGVPTIGYGHTRGVAINQSITQDEANTFLSMDLFTAERAVEASVFTLLNQNQFDSLVSFVFNLGETALLRSTLLKDINKKAFDDVASNFKKWVYAGNVVMPGLVLRRDAEARLFDTPINQNFAI